MSRPPRAAARRPRAGRVGRRVRDAVLRRRGHRSAVAGAGDGRAAGRGRARSPVDAVLDLARADRRHRAQPGRHDGRGARRHAAARAAGRAGRHGQRLAFDAARVGDGATVGGLLATADAGPRRAGLRRRCATWSSASTLVLADGTVARSGGHVIKNVAGYDLPSCARLARHARRDRRGRCCRLHPLPQATATLVLLRPTRRERAAAASPRARRWSTARSLADAGVGSSAPTARVTAARDSRGSRGAAAARPWPERACRRRGGARRRAATASWPDDGGDLGVHARAHAAAPLDDAVLRLGVRPSRLPRCWRAGAAAATAGLGDRRRDRRAAAGPDAVAAAHAAVHAAGGTLGRCAAGRRRRRAAPGARRRPRWRVLSVGQGAVRPRRDGSGRAGSTPWLP